MVAASSSLVLVNGLGAVLGPVAVAGLMRAVGPDGFFWFLAAVYLGMGVLAFRHMAARESPAPARQGGAGPVPLAAVFAVEQGAAPAGGGASGIGPAGPAPLPESASAAVRP